jgi:hypothetical protein
MGEISFCAISGFAFAGILCETSMPASILEQASGAHLNSVHGWFDADAAELNS